MWTEKSSKELTLPLDFLHSVEVLQSCMVRSEFDVDFTLSDLGILSGTKSFSHNPNPTAMLSNGFRNEFRIDCKVSPRTPYMSLLTVTIRGSSEFDVRLTSAEYQVEEFLRELVEVLKSGRNNPTEANSTAESWNTSAKNDSDDEPF